ncbi:MAG: AraC family transcriptional regulator [Bacteroidales bacterium]|jgi:AraC-like DNA-binding protein|nr:AraC family transcriptional regulator [Bacteroidales bacterium]
METLAWIGLTQSLFGAVLVGTKSGVTLPDRLLAVWLLLMAFVFLSLGLDLRNNSFTILTSSFLAFNPLLYLYASASTISNFKLKWHHSLHIVPFLFFEIYSHLTLTEFLPGSFLERDSAYSARLIFSIINIISWFVYTSIALTLIHKHRINLKNELSSIDSSDRLSWLLFISIFYTVYWIILLIASLTIVTIKSPSTFPMVYSYIVMLGMSMIISYYGVRQREIHKFFWKSSNSQKNVENLAEETEIRLQAAECAIKNFLIDEKGFTDPDLSLQTLSEKTGFPRYVVTEVLNKRMNTNFFTYVNGLRTEEAKRLLSSIANKYSIEATGNECGFKSRSSFYTFFKKSVGMTPNEYKLSKSNQIDV